MIIDRDYNRQLNEIIIEQTPKFTTTTIYQQSHKCKCRLIIITSDVYDLFIVDLSLTNPEFRS